MDVPERDVVVIGASAGGVEALQRIVGSLPADLPAALFAVMHVAPRSRSMLPEILSSAGPLRAVHPEDGDAVERGAIYVAPPTATSSLSPVTSTSASGPRNNTSARVST